MIDVLAFGLRIRSALPISGAMPIQAAEPDVRIVFGRSRHPIMRGGGPYDVTATGFTFTMPGLARYIVDGGDHVTIEPAPDASRAHLSAMLIATVLPALLWTRGDVMLHAAAVLLPGTTRALAIAGASGIGKSSLLARLVAAGGAAIADDSIRVAGDEIVAHGLPGGRFARGADHEDRAFVAFPPDRHCAYAPLGAIVILSLPDAAPERLRGAAAIEALLAQRHRPAIARLMRREGALLPAIAAIAATVPIVRWPVANRSRSAAPPC